MASVTERVRAGATLLDERVVGWANGINRSRLDLGKCRDCIFGQTYGYFDAGLTQLRLDDDEAKALGFLASLDGMTLEELQGMSPEECDDHQRDLEAEYRQLTSAWLAEIDARLGLTAAGDEADETDLAPVATPEQLERWGACPL